MFLCYNCGAVFLEPKHYSAHAPDEMLPFAEWDGCPECSSDDIDEAHVCSVCGEYMTEGYYCKADDTYYCENCIEPVGQEDV